MKDKTIEIGFLKRESQRAMTLYSKGKSQSLIILVWLLPPVIQGG